MANDFSRNPWRVDTALTVANTAQVEVASRMYIKSVRWASGTTAGHICQILSWDGKELWSSVASGANYVEEDLVETWWPWFRVQLIQSGVVFITYK